MLTKKAIEVLKAVYLSGHKAAKIDRSVCESENEWNGILDALDELEELKFIHYFQKKDSYSVELESKGIAYCEQHGF